MGPSFRQSLSHALHSLQNPHFFRRSPLTVPLCKDNNPPHETFDLDLCNRLSRLDRAEQGYLSLPWLQNSMSVVLFAYSSVLDFLPKSSFKEKEKWLLEANLEDSLKILDACNGLKEVMNDLQHYVMLVRYAARTGADVRDASDEACKSKLTRVNDALLKSVDFMHARDEGKSRLRDGRSKLETCSSVLRRMGEQMSDSSSGGTLFNEIYASKVLAIFICSVLATALSVKPERPLALLHLADHPDWSALLQILQQNVRKATDEGIKDGKIMLLEELDQVRLCAHELHVLLSKILEQGSLPADVDRLSLSHQCGKLFKHAEELQQGLLVLQQQIDDLFRMLIATRVDFLDALCHETTSPIAMSKS